MSQAETLLAGDLGEQREGLDRGDVSASELVDASLERIEAFRAPPRELILAERPRQSPRGSNPDNAGIKAP